MKAFLDRVPSTGGVGGELSCRPGYVQQKVILQWMNYISAFELCFVGECLRGKGKAPDVEVAAARPDRRTDCVVCRACSTRGQAVSACRKRSMARAELQGAHRTENMRMERWNLTACAGRRQCNTRAECCANAFDASSSKRQVPACEPAAVDHECFITYSKQGSSYAADLPGRKSSSELLLSSIMK